MCSPARRCPEDVPKRFIRVPRFYEERRRQSRSSKGGSYVGSHVKKSSNRCYNGEEKTMVVASAAMLWQIKPILEDQGIKFNEELGVNVKLFEVGEDTTIDTTIIEAGGWIVETETYDDMSQG